MILAAYVVSHVLCWVDNNIAAVGTDVDAGFAPVQDQLGPVAGGRQAGLEALGQGEEVVAPAGAADLHGRARRQAVPPHQLLHQLQPIREDANLLGLEAVGVQDDGVGRPSDDGQRVVCIVAVVEGGVRRGPLPPRVVGEGLLSGGGVPRQACSDGRVAGLQHAAGVGEHGVGGWHPRGMSVKDESTPCSPAGGCSSELGSPYGLVLARSRAAEPSCCAALEHVRSDGLAHCGRLATCGLADVRKVVDAAPWPCKGHHHLPTVLLAHMAWLVDEYTTRFPSSCMVRV